ncbi:hypothetical protein ACX80P_06615 [Arthrobacter sp. TMS1-12-1]
MPLTGQGFSLLGISLFGPNPLNAVHLDFDEGLSALYGLNGTGKTTILQEAEAVLRGIGPNHAGGPSSSRSCLHVQLTSLSEPFTGFDVSRFEESIEQSFFNQKEDSSAPVGATRFERWQWMLNHLLRKELDSEWIWSDPPLSQQKAIFFCLVPIGSPSRPAWRSYLSIALEGDQLEALSNSLQRHRHQITDILSGAMGTEFNFDALQGEASPVAAFGETPWTTISAETGGLERDFITGWPSNFPLPVSPIGNITALPVHVISDNGTIESIRDTTNNQLVFLADEFGDLIDIADAENTQLNPQFLAAVSKLENEANEFLEVTGPHYFELRLELKSPHEWFVGEIPEWYASSSGAELGLGRLSGAELRWALAALQWATSGLDTTRPQVFLIDEPERGLHRAREQELPRMLSKLCGRSPNLMILAASHAPSFLDVRHGVRLQHVTRLRGFPTMIRPVDLGSSALVAGSAEELGLTPGDLLQLTRVFVLVEGAHDEIVLKAALGKEIQDAGGRLIPINGATHARSIADARILFDASAASVVFVLDNVRGPDALRIWEQATQQYAVGQRKAARSTLAQLSKLGSGGEVVWLQELGERAIDTNLIHRIKPFGLSKRDILCYLSPAAFKLENTTWDDLSKEYEHARRNGFSKENFKSWLKHMRGANFSRETVCEAAQGTDLTGQSEFTALSLMIQEIGLHGPIDDLERSVGT